MSTMTTMMATSQLLDTPKRISVQSQLQQARAALKDFERSFAANNDGRKPSKNDIKSDREIAAKYREYNKLRDVLDGKLGYAELSVPLKSPTRRRRRDSGISGTPKKKRSSGTCAQSSPSSQLDDLDAMDSVSPRPLLLHAIGPTPQRDGRVLGLFDLLSNSAHTQRATTSGKKRKIDDLLEDSPAGAVHASISQTPSRKVTQRKGDLLEFLTGTPAKTPETETRHRKHSRTPLSDGRRFMLSQFFATPSTARHSRETAHLPKELTPLRDRLLGVTPTSKAQTLQPAADITPAYLRRSTSFKDRLLSASQTSLFDKSSSTQPSTTRAGPPTLRHFRSVPNMFRVMDTEPGEVEQQDYDDDMEALREMENGEVNGLERGSRQNSPAEDNDHNDSLSQRTWKKKGQKRTTRKTTMRPARGPIAQAPTFVLAGNASDDEENISHGRDSKAKSQPPSGKIGLWDDVRSDAEYSASEQNDSESEKVLIRNQSKKQVNNKLAKSQVNKGGTINPNATSHMNFRSLKIKNKNSKAKGRGRFGRGRR